MSLRTWLFGELPPTLRHMSIVAEMVGTTWMFVKVKASHDCRTEYFEYARVVEVFEEFGFYRLRFEYSCVDCCGTVVYREQPSWFVLPYPLHETEKVFQIAQTEYDEALFSIWEKRL